jgi:hypothetical protein
MAYETSPETPSGNVVALGNKVEVLPGAPVHDVRFGGGPTFSARLKGDTSSGLVAVICNSGLPVRSDLVTALRTADHPSLLKLVDSGIVAWPADNARYFAFAYARPAAPPMMQSLAETTTQMSEDAINHYFVTPITKALLELERVGVVHNGIRPTNIYWRIGSATVPQLGEFLSLPPGYGQPAMFEPIERGMSNPNGRGPGAHVDDCYAFGITLAMLINGSNPLQNMDDRAIVQAKAERGTFNTMMGNNRLSASHIELLRGLLADDPRQRWSAGDLEQWLNGRRLTPKSSDSGRRAARSFEFNGGEYWQVRPLANALPQNTAEAVRVVEDGSLDKWLRRALVDDSVAEKLSEAMASLKEGGRGLHYEDQLTAYTCIALDSVGPLRYRGLSVMPMGIANMLVDAANTGQNVQALSEIISSQMVTLWVDMQKEVKTEMVPLGQQFERMRMQIDKTSLGNGFERVLYEVNPQLPCLSPIIKSQYVTHPKALLPALEQVAKSGNRSREPMDRHIAAFLVVRDRRSELLFDAMSAPETSPRRGIALITLFTEMQSRHGPDHLPGLAQWLLPMLETSTRRYLGKVLRERTSAQLKEAAERGDLNALLRLVDDPRRITFDQQEFMAARMLYLNTMKEIAHLEGQLAHRDDVAHKVGRPLAATVSSLLAIIFVLLAILRVVWQNMF